MIDIVPLRALDFALLCQFLVLHYGSEDGEECEDSIVEHCEDLDGDCDIEAYSPSLFFFTVCSFGNSLFFLLILHF